MRDALYTTVVNTSGAARHFGYLGAHGITLAADAQYSHPGNLLRQVARKPRQLAALQADLAAGVLEIMNTPAVVLWDNTRDEAKVLTLADGALAAADSGWQGDYSSSYTPPPAEEDEEDSSVASSA